MDMSLSSTELSTGGRILKTRILLFIYLFLISSSGTESRPNIFTAAPLLPLKPYKYSQIIQIAWFDLILIAALLLLFCHMSEIRSAEGPSNVK